jgi:hypothetical protein
MKVRRLQGRHRHSKIAGIPEVPAMRLHVLLRGLSSRGLAAAVLTLVLVTTALAGSASAQGTPFYPYFNKNNIHYA